MRRALTGVHTFFMIPLREAPDRAGRHVAALEVAAIVYPESYRHLIPA